MVAHMNNIHEGKNKKEPDGEHLCDVCGKSYKVRLWFTWRWYLVRVPVKRE